MLAFLGAGAAFVFYGAHLMPAKSKAQQRAAGAALAAKRGQTSKRKLKGASKDMEASMSERELRDFAETSHDKLPDKKHKPNRD